jgi:predicted nucleotide-binding protein
MHGKFLRQYDGERLPRRDIALNVLQATYGVPPDRADETLDLIEDNCEFAGAFRNVNGQHFIQLSGAARANAGNAPVAVLGESESNAAQESKPLSDSQTERQDARPDLRSGRVFISHGKNTKVVDQLKEIVTFGKLTPIVSVENVTVSKPVPDKVMDDMRSCFAGVIHVAGDSPVVDSDGKLSSRINENVLIEIGAALALYGRNIILLVEDGTTLPSNLQGLFEVRYSGDMLDGAATMRVLKAFNDFRPVVSG